MALMSNALENDLVNHTFRNIKFKSPENVWLGLFYGDPMDTMKNTELVGAGYKREKVIFDSPQDGLIKNSHIIIYHYARKQWKKVTHAALFDMEDGGTLLFHGKIVKPVVVTKDKNFVIKTHELHLGYE